MLELRLVKLSIYYYIKDKLTASGWGSEGYYNDDVVTFMDAFPNDDELNRIVKTPTGMAEAEIVLPIIALEAGMQTQLPFELGSKSATTRQFTLSIMGRDKAESEDLAQTVYEWLDGVLIPINNYNQGFPTGITPNTIGYAETDNLRIIPIRSTGSPDVADRNRLEIMFNALTYFTDDSADTFPT